MKIHRKILFRIIFLLTVFFCYGINTYSNYNFHPFSLEFPASTNSIENDLISDYDSFDDDQINFTNEFSTLVENNYQLVITQNSLLILNSFFSVWQPPKIS